jgi:hypothetical protein
MKFYRYIFFKVYSLFEKLNARNAHNSAIGIVSLPIMLIVYRIHSLISERFLNQKLDYDKIAIPYLIAFFAIYAANYFLLQWDSKYLETEDFFKKKEQPKSYDFLLIGLVAFMIVIFVI